MNERKAGGPRPAPARARSRRVSEREGVAVRRAALEILLRVEEQSAFADVLLGHRIGGFAPADKRLLTRLVLGTLAWRGRLDYEIAALSSRKLESLAPAVLVILRLGLFQLRFLTRVPKHAAVDTSVTIARENRATRAAAGFVNAILRRAALKPLALPDRSADEAGYLAVAYSHPRWLVERFIEWFGIDGAERLMAANNEPAPNAIRLNLKRGGREEIVERMRADGFEFADGGRLSETALLKGAPRLDAPTYRCGFFHLQSEASQLVARMLAPAMGSIVVDCAAAPGGKTTHLAELVGDRVTVVALDRNFAGLKRARAVASRLGHRNIAFVRADLEAAIPIRPASRDYVLLDAPCTGLGTLREHPEIRWRLRPAALERMAELQSRMLENAAAIVRPGGAVVYAVCSLAPQEGKHVIAGFLLRHPEFRLDAAPPIRGLIEAAFDPEGAMLTRPDRDGLDGFFAARLLRR